MEKMAHLCVVLCLCVDVLRPSQQFFSRVRMSSVLKQCKADDKALLKDIAKCIWHVLKICDMQKTCLLHIFQPRSVYCSKYSNLVTICTSNIGQLHNNFLFGETLDL